MNIVKKIILGFSLLAITILVVGIGGITGIVNINQQLQVVSDDSIPKLEGSYQQILSLNHANQALLHFLNSDADKFQQHIDTFDQSFSKFTSELEQLKESTDAGTQMHNALIHAQSAAAEYYNSAKDLKTLHGESILIDRSMVSEAQLFQSQIDSLGRWGQRYISSGKASPDAVSAFQSLNKSINNIRLNIRIYEKTKDLEQLKSSMSDLKGKMKDAFTSFQNYEPKATRIAGVIEGITGSLEENAGLLGAYISKDQNQRLDTEKLAAAEGFQAQAEKALHEVLEIGLTNTDRARANAAQTIVTSESLIITLSIAGLIIAVIIGWLILRTIRQPLAEIQKQLGELSQGNLTVEFDQSRNDEFGQLGSNLNKVTLNLRDILKQLLKNSQELSRVATENEQISLSTTKAMDQQSLQLEQTSAAATELEHSVADVSQHSNATLTSVQQCDELGLDAHKKMEQTHNSITAQSQVIESAMIASTALAEDGKKIDSILDTINTIAEQTNLLALNAAIEAARAGDHGRGFAVVADEVRQLASRTQNSTVEIQSMVSSMQQRISSVVQSMQESHEQADLCVNYARSSNEALLAMQTAIQTIRHMNTQIAEASSEQTHAVQEVSRTLVNINVASTETAKGANKASESSSGLLHIAQAQRSIIQRFRT